MRLIKRQEYLWLIGGTSESVKVAELLSENNLPYLVSVTTNSAKNLYCHLPQVNFFVGKLQFNEIISFMIEHKIKMVIDASHPYAINISQGAIASCQSLQIPYLRYERPCFEVENSPIINVTNIETILDNNYLENKRVLLTIGCQSLFMFKDYHNKATLFARILPYLDSIKMANEAGFNCDRLIAIKPPFSLELEKALWKLWEIDIVITKASGKSGGEDIKYEVAKALNIPLIIISRPKINYPFVTSNLEELLKIMLLS
jgi:precorrin-6A/cobalt-precorrin-6A reductase